MANSTRRRSISVSIGEVNEDEAIEKMPPRATKWTTMRNMRIEGHIDRSRAPLQDQRNVVSRRAMQKTEKLRRSASEAPGNRRSTGVSMATHIYSRFKGVLSNLVRHRVEEPIGGDVEPRANLPVSNVSDERCASILADNILYMYAYQFLPINFDHSQFGDRKRTVYYAWLHEIWSYHPCYHPTNSFFLAVHLLDRFLVLLSGTQLKDEEKRLESAGLAALQLAVKFETQCPLAEDLVRTFKIAEINRYEHVLLELCNFELGRHSVMDFTRLVLEAITPLSSRDRLSNQRHSRAKLLAVLSVFAPSLTSVKPSLVAAAIGRLLVFSENRAWTPEMQEKLQHSTKEVYPVLEDLVIHIGLCKESTWAGKDLIKYWRKNGADIEEFTDCLLSDLTRLYEEEAEEF
ncbi:unnamed protein product, partial [Mesorhabditis belari]|uniref:Cyclin N-terminal domain-containing protein n=1 Tax=Mesorhabditis belari TaxID=2138241 RepID=A0AAF3F0A1_9BILA